MDLPALAQHLVDTYGFSRQGTFAFSDSGGCIMHNTASVGDHVYTSVQMRLGRTTSTKFYNKVVSQLEAGEVRETFGRHLAHYVHSTNKHLYPMLRHPDVQRSGCTRTGVPLYVCVSEDLSKTVTEELVVEALEQASIKEGACCVSKRCWKRRRAWTGEHEWKKLQRKTEIRQKEIERLEAATKEIPELWEERAATRIAVQRALLDDGHKKAKNWLGSFSSSWSAGIRKPAGKELLLKDKRRPNGLCLGEKWPEKNLRQPSVMFSKGGGRLQPHDAVVAKKKHQTAYLCARPPNLLEQRRSKNCLEPHCRTIHPKGERATGAAKTTGKLEAGRAFGENKGGGGTNKIGLLCDSADQNCKKNWISLHANIPSRTAQRQSLNVPRTILSFPQWGRTVNNKQETRKRLFGVRLFKKKSKKESLGSIEGRLYCRLVQEKSTKNKKK